MLPLEANPGCDMLALILFVVQILAYIALPLCAKTEDPRFEGDKLQYRS